MLWYDFVVLELSVKAAGEWVSLEQVWLQQWQPIWATLDNSL